jgi:hypothetical protein
MFGGGGFLRTTLGIRRRRPRRLRRDAAHGDAGRHAGGVLAQPHRG